MSGTNVTTAAVQSQPKQKRHLVRTLGKSLREYRKPSILTPIFVVVEGVLEILIPTVMASLIDEGIFLYACFSRLTCNLNIVNTCFICTEVVNIFVRSKFMVTLAVCICKCCTFTSSEKSL